MSKDATILLFTIFRTHTAVHFFLLKGRGNNDMFKVFRCFALLLILFVCMLIVVVVLVQVCFVVVFLLG